MTNDLVLRRSHQEFLCALLALIRVGSHPKTASLFSICVKNMSSV